jgi:hypothetical protein
VNAGLLSVQRVPTVDGERHTDPQRGRCRGSGWVLVTRDSRPALSAGARAAKRVNRYRSRTTRRSGVRRDDLRARRSADPDRASWARHDVRTDPQARRGGVPRQNDAGADSGSFIACGTREHAVRRVIASGRRRPSGLCETDDGRARVTSGGFARAARDSTPPVARSDDAGRQLRKSRRPCRAARWPFHQARPCRGSSASGCGDSTRSSA